MQNQPHEPYDARELLEECNAMAALTEEMAGKKFREIAAYFMNLETHYIKLKKKVAERIASNEKPAAITDKEPNIIQMQGTPTEDQYKQEPAAAAEEAPAREPRIVPVGGEITNDAALKIVSETMLYLDQVKKTFDGSKQDISELYEDVKKDADSDPLRIALDTIIKIQNPQEQKNPAFIEDLRKGGIEHFSQSLKAFSAFLPLVQKVIDENYNKLNARLSQLELIKGVLDQLYASIGQFFKQVLENASKDYESHTNNTDLHKLQMDTISLLVEQKNLLDGMRKHLQEFAALNINLLYIKSRQLNLLTRVQTLNASLLNSIFFPAI
jgi:hypothetical protein